MNQELANKLSVSSQLGESVYTSYSVLGHIPLTASKLRRFGEIRAADGFLSCLVDVLVEGGSLLDISAGDSRAIYPWTSTPILIAVNGSTVLLDRDQRPVRLTDYFSLSRVAIERAGQEGNASADLIYAGELAEIELGQAGRTAPVLALTSAWEKYLDLGSEFLNLVGPDGEQISVADIVAARSGGQWVNARLMAELEFDDAASTAEARQWGELVSAVVALNHWHATAGFDAATGQPTTVIHAGWARQNAEGKEVFPRTDPAVITAVTALIDGEEKILLGQARVWGAGRFSTFAGFVEVGESLESAVVREIAEECSGHVESMRYLGSQPWPFPRSLMLGFIARINNPSSVEADGHEIETIRWFSRTELKEAHESGDITLPGRASISRKLIEYFLGEQLCAGAR